MTKIQFLGWFSAVLGVTACTERTKELGEPAQVRELLTVPAPALSEYAVLAQRAASFGDRALVTGGDLGVAPSSTATLNVLTGGFDSVLGVGQVLLAQRVVLRDGATAGEIGATQIEADDATTGPQSAFVAPPALPVPGSFTAGSTGINVNGGQTITVAPGKYGAVTVTGTLNLSGGLYEVQSVRLNPDARLTALGAATLRVTGGVSAADRSRITAAASVGAGNFRLMVNGTADAAGNGMTLGVEGQLSALVVARFVFRSADRSVLTGAIAAQDVIMGVDSRLTYATGFQCNTNASCDDANPCSVDTCVDTRCTHANAANGSACSDGNGCTQTDACQAGTCVGTNPITCTASDQCHNAGTCTPATGTCTNPNKPNGSVCNDSSACTPSDSCQAGVCTGSNPVVCTASDQCHDPGTCNPANGVCSNPQKPNGSACSDGNACTSVDACQGGACAGTSPVVCASADQCHDPGTCNPATGACSNPPKPDGTACTDLNACTQSDTCLMGACAGDNPVVCAALDECHLAGICNPATGLCSDPAQPDGTDCDDGDDCTIGDACEAGDCAAGDDYAVSEYPTGVNAPGSIVSGPLDSLWLVGRATTPETFDGSIVRVSTAGAVLANETFARDPYTLLAGPDGLLWLGERFLGGLPTLGRYDAESGFFVSEYFLGVQAYDMTSSNDAGMSLVWITAGGSVVRVAPDGTVLSTTPTLNTARAITSAAPNPNTRIWLTEASAGGVAYIGRIDYPTLMQFPISTPGELFDLVEGADGNIWYTDAGTNEIGSLSPSGSTLSHYPLPTESSTPYAIAKGPDSRVWFTLRDANKIGRISSDGELLEICIPTEESGPTAIVTGPDGHVWFTETLSGKVGKVTVP